MAIFNLKPQFGKLKESRSISYKIEGLRQDKEYKILYHKCRKCGKIYSYEELKKRYED